MAITLALLLVGLISMLGLVTVAQYYWAKRSAQKVADLAALSGAQNLSNCSAALSTATSIAKVNWASALDGSISRPDPASPVCGIWDPARYTSSPEHFHQPASASSAPNAIRVTATVTPRTIFYPVTSGTALAVSATAIATTRPIAAFSVGSRLLEVNTDTSVLAPLLGSDLATHLGLSLISSDGIANGQISLLDLINNSSIDAGTVDDVLKSDVTVNDLLNATAEALPENDGQKVTDFMANLDESTAGVTLENTEITLNDILNVDAYTNNPDAALDTKVNAADIINAVLQAANKKNGVSLNATGIHLGIASVGIYLTVIEPPQIGIGGVGTTARTAQINLHVTASLAIVGKLLDLPLPITSAQATIKSIGCNLDGNGFTYDEVDFNPYEASVLGSGAQPKSQDLRTCLPGMDGACSTSASMGGSAGNIINPSQYPLLATVLNTLLNPLLNGLLKALGIEVGTGQVNLISVTCNASPRLVY